MVNLSPPRGARAAAACRRSGRLVGVSADAFDEVRQRDVPVLLSLAPRRALIVENEITYLSAGVPESGVVIWGRGFAVDAAGRLPWLTPCDVDYWGDLDSHGFAILDRLRAWLPQVRSVLMDTDTLLSHHDRWVTEAKPTSAVLPRLTSAERDVYTGLVEDRFGSGVRQERVDWARATARLPYWPRPLPGARCRHPRGPLACGVTRKGARSRRARLGVSPFRSQGHSPSAW